ncbi:hypothetical protein FGU71_04625 [Erythrobacter insulae]|uniref:GlsB/YeaQ/YmgE family stress response membrane protein n=1 Tax=Erythrobacter insulae TaxID=2584124 RepID=A0A547PAM9_9SPHN|nr:hypothetical protein [Erythrobacter insulae]TRD11206.1 hypothetical protein FGU71_04625 [Erythrobacter insulae]
MALLVLIVLGATLGWLASIIARHETPRVILRQIGAGLVGTLATGLFANDWTIVGGLSLIALGVGFAGGVVILIAFHFIVGDAVEA